MLVRRYTDNREQQADSPVIGIIGALDIYIVYKSVQWWRGLHPWSRRPRRGGLDRNEKGLPVLHLRLLVSTPAHGDPRFDREGGGELAVLRERLLKRSPREGALPYLFWAYNLIWIFIAVYIGI